MARKIPIKKMTLQQQADEILKIAQEYGVEQNFFFLTTFKRYQVQMNILSALEKTIKDEPTIVTKEYIKGRGNDYVHPAVREYNNTVVATNNTTSTLLKIISNMRESKEDENKLIKFITGK